MVAAVCSEPLPLLPKILDGDEEAEVNSKNNRRLICCKRRATFRWVPWFFWVRWFWAERNVLTGVGVVVVGVAVAGWLPVGGSLVFIRRMASTPMDAILTRRRLVVAGTFTSAASSGTATATIVLRSCLIIIMVVTIDLIYCAFVLMINDS